MAWRQSRTGFSSIDSTGRTNRERVGSSRQSSGGGAAGFGLGGSQSRSASAAAGFGLGDSSRSSALRRSSSSSGFGLGSGAGSGPSKDFRPSSGFGSLAGEEPAKERKRPAARARLVDDDFSLGSVGSLNVLTRKSSTKAGAIAQQPSGDSSASKPSGNAAASEAVAQPCADGGAGSGAPAAESLEKCEAKLETSAEDLGGNAVAPGGISDEQLSRLVEEGRTKSEASSVPEPARAVCAKHSLDDAEADFDMEEEAPDQHEPFEEEPSDPAFAEGASTLRKEDPAFAAKSRVESVPTPQTRATRPSMDAMSEVATPSPVAREPKPATGSEPSGPQVEESAVSPKRRKASARGAKPLELDSVSGTTPVAEQSAVQPRSGAAAASSTQPNMPLPCWGDMWSAFEDEGWRIEMSGSKTFFMPPGVQRGKQTKLNKDYFDNKKLVIDYFMAVATAAHEAAECASPCDDHQETDTDPKKTLEGESEEEEKSTARNQDEAEERDNESDGIRDEEAQMEESGQDSKEEWQEFTPANVDLSRCMARTWAGGRGGQCPRSILNAGACGLHKDGKMPCGRVDGPIPLLKLKEFKSVKARKTGCADGETPAKVKACRTKRVQSPAQQGSEVAKKARIQAPASEEGTPQTAMVEKKAPLAKRKPATKKAQPLKGIAAPPPGAASLVPFGANFVTQDLRKKHKGSFKGGTKLSRHVGRYFGKNGKLKSQYLPRSEGREYDGSTGFVSKLDRKRNRAFASLADRTLVASGAKAKLAFSSSVTAELLSAVPSVGLGEIAEVRPPDAVPAAAEPVEDSTARAARELLQAAAGDDAEPAPLSKPEPPTAAEPTVAANVDRNGHIALPVATKRPQDYSNDDLDQVLRQSFGHQDFRPGQREALTSLLADQRVLLLLSTGSGKSLCYQLPAFLLREEGLTLVISPLLSLMNDQLQRLPSCLRGAIVSSQQNSEEVKTVMRAVRARLVDVLFISPERLSMWAFDGCGLPRIALACIDEAHCVSEWSHNFRPDYMRIHEFLSGSLNARRVLALTATATRPTIKSICEILRMDRIVRSDKSFSLEEIIEEPKQPRVQRTNLTMEVRCYEDEDQQGRELVKILTCEENRRVPAIVYVWKRATCDQLAKRLRNHVLGGVRSYHGSLDPEIRRAVQGSFMSGETRVVIATMAFGMGLDKPDIRCVVHYNLPKSIENYIQETGRCSRDGERGRCIGMANPSDYKVMRWMESGGGGGGMQSGSVHKLLGRLLSDGAGRAQDKFEVKDDSVDPPPQDAGGAGRPWRPYNVAFDEARMSNDLGIPKDEMHSVLVHFAYHARESVTLYSRFPTKLKLRFFKASPEVLMTEDALLRKLMPMAKKVAGVYTLDTAKVMAEIGGEPGRISNALWQAQGDEFKVQKDEYGYMLHVHKQPTEDQIDAWAANICNINKMARKNSIEKLDACYIAFRRGAELTAKAKALLEMGRDEDAGEGAAAETADETLNTIINSYFAATEDPAAVVAGGENDRMMYLRKALGSEYSPSAADHTSSSAPPSARHALGQAPPAAAARGQAQNPDSSAVYPVVARLLLSSEWPKLPGDHECGEARAAAQFLAGIGTQMMPARTWRNHALWGRFKSFAEFAHLEDLVAAAMTKLRALRASKK